MTDKKSVLVIGLQPALIDFSDPDDAAYPGMNAAKVLAGLKASEDHLKNLGYDVQMCLTDFGDTAEAVVLDQLKQKRVRLHPHWCRRANGRRKLHTV